MFECRCRRRRGIRSVFLFALGFCGFFACFSWYTLQCCRPEAYQYAEDGPSNSSSVREAEGVAAEGRERTSLGGRLREHHQRHGKHGASDTGRRTVRTEPTVTTAPLVPSDGVVRVTSSRLQDAESRAGENDLRTLDSSATVPSLDSTFLPPTVELDQYAVRAWLPRGIKERTESSSPESSRTLTMDILPRYSLPTPIYSDQSDSGQKVLVYGSQTKRTHGFSPPVKRLPQALIIGVKKCGTRALLEFLKVHPDIRATGPETHFFDRHYQRGLEWYRQQMPTSLEGQITMEKTPSYFITKEAPPRIHAMAPAAVRLLVVVRDPVTRAVSDYTQSTSKRKRDNPSFEEMAFLNASTGLVDTSWSAIRIGVYARFLEWWTRYFGPDRMLFVSGEALVRDPAGEMARVQDFLGLKRVISEKHFYFNETKGFPCLKKSEGSGNPHCLGKTKGRTHPDISPATVQRLRDFYRPFNARFYQMVGRNFGWP